MWWAWTGDTNRPQPTRERRERERHTLPLTLPDNKCVRRPTELDPSLEEGRGCSRPLIGWIRRVGSVCFSPPCFVCWFFCTYIYVFHTSEESFACATLSVASRRGCHTEATHGREAFWCGKGQRKGWWLQRNGCTARDASHSEGRPSAPSPPPTAACSN